MSHSDVKSQNILLDKNFKAFIADFGSLCTANIDTYTQLFYGINKLAGTYPGPFSLAAHNNQSEWGDTYQQNLRGILNRENSSTDLRIIDVFAFGVMINEILFNKPLETRHLSSQAALQEWISSSINSLQLHLHDPIQPMGIKLWAKRGITSLSVTFDVPHTMSDIHFEIQDTEKRIQDEVASVLETISKEVVYSCIQERVDQRLSLNLK